MKLAAIWVENFMKIKDQGFNFGGKYNYEFNFNDQDRSLKINYVNTADYYDLFNDSVINNISGIIGINGSGKSSLLKLLNVISAEKPIDNNVVVIIENTENESFEIISYKSTLPNFGSRVAINILLPDKGILSKESVNNQKLIVNKNLNPLKQFDLIFYSNLSSNQNVNYLGLDNSLNRSVDYQIRKSLTPRKVSEYINDYNIKKDTNKMFLEESFNLNSIYQNDRLERMISFFSEINETQVPLLKEIPFPDKITIWFNETIFTDYYKFIEGRESNFKSLESITQHCFSLYNKEEDPKEKLKKGIIFHFFFFALYNNLFTYSDETSYLDNFYVYVNSLLLDDNIFNSILKYLITLKAPSHIKTIDKIKDLLINLDSLFENIEIRESIEFFAVGNFELSINKYLWNFLKQILQITDYKSESLINYSITPFSSGEEAILYQLSEFHEAFKFSTKENIIISIDEGELYLHPEWQRKYINTLYLFFKYYGIKYNKKIQIIVTSHSPFIVSDIPKHNLIFLKKDQLGNCKVSKSENHLPTLGGNIFELFSDGFFVKEFISAFAFDKIDQAIKWLNGEISHFESILDVENFNKLIGEPLIRDEIQKMIDLTKRENFDDYFELIKINEINSKND